MLGNNIDNDIKSSYITDIKQGYILSKIILDKKDKSKVVDGMILDTNGNLTELLNIAGISATDTLKKVMSHMTDSQFKEFLDLYSKAALEKKQKSLIQYSEKLEAWISIDMISPQPDYVMLIFTDVTDEINKEKHIENLVKYQKQLTELFFNVISDVILVISKDDRIVFANKAFYEITDNKYETGIKLDEIYPKENKQRLKNIFKEIKNKKILNNIPVTLLTNTGIEIPMIYSAIILKLWETEYCFIVLKEAKKTEKDLEDALEQQNKFISMVAHDLKGPIDGCASYIKELSENLQLLSQEELGERLTYLSTSLENIYKLLEDLLEWSRIECKTIDFNLDTTMPHIIVNTIINTMLLNAKYKHIKLINNIDSNLTIQADAKMLSTILRNLISNAVKFTNKDGKIIISHTENKDFHIISVSDDGIGMSEEIKNNLFKNPNYTSRTGTAGETSTGLGLVICKEYVEKHGGKIWVESEENKGTTFYFTIPRKDEKI